MPAEDGDGAVVTAAAVVAHGLDCRKPVLADEADQGDERDYDRRPASADFLWSGCRRGG